MSVPAALAPLCARPLHSALFLDFDGTLAPIVDDPALARPLPGVPDLLVELGARFKVVAVVSGRPADFLLEHLGTPADVRLIGLYGLQEVGRPTGPSVSADALDAWRPTMARLADRAEAGAPPGILVERKAIGFTLHYRHAPERAGWAQRFADDAVRESGVHLQHGRMAIELRAGIDVDKGSVVRTLAVGCEAACCFGDDLGDLPAFAALVALTHSGMAIARVAVADDETPPEVRENADLVVEGPPGALALLRELAAAVPR